MTAREVAIRLIRPYVERGDSIASLKAGSMGAFNDTGAAQISGHIDSKHYSSDFIIVTRIGGYRSGKKVQAVFKLKEIYDEIANGQQRLF